VSQWLQSLEAFAGAFYKRCPFVEFRGIISYLMRRLKDGNVMELGVLRTLLKNPGGLSFADYSPAASLSVTQLEGRAGSMTLKRETMSFGIVEKVNRRAAERIRDVLQTDGCGVSMLIMIAQVRSRVLFESASGKSKPVKLVGNLYDSCQVVMSILMEFLTEVVDEAKGDNGQRSAGSALARYADVMPTLEELGKTYGFDVASAWMLCRPLLRAAAAITNGKRESAKENGGLKDKLKSFALTEDRRKAYQSMMPESTWSYITADLFECFYTNSLYDVFCPENLYTTEVSRLNKEVERVQQRPKSGVQTSLQPGQGPPKNEDSELERLKTVSSTLSSDLSKQKEIVASVLAKMETEKMHFFPSDKVSEQGVNTFFTHCIFPRTMQSPDDAMYCAKFVSLLHQIETPGFSILHYIDELVTVVSGALFGVTEGEAAHLAILLFETWKSVNKWRYDETIFDAEVLGKRGSSMATSADSSGNSDEGDCTSVSYKDFAALYNKWHSSLGAALISCLKSPEYMHTRAGLVVLTRIVEVFPTRPKLGNTFLEVLSPFQEDSNSRLDIKANASAYATMLVRARDDGKWIEEDAAVVKARVDKEKAAVKARKKKIEEQFQEIKRDTEKITEEIGPTDRNDRRRMPAPRTGQTGPDTLKSKVRNHDIVFNLRHMKSFCAQQFALFFGVKDT
jgi:THO complex subunit 2